MELASRKRIIGGIASVIVGMGLCIHGGCRIGRTSEFYSWLFEERIKATYEDRQMNLTQEDLKREERDLTIGGYSVGFGLGAVIAGYLLGGTATITRWQEKKRKEGKSFSTHRKGQRYEIFEE